MVREFHFPRLVAGALLVVPVLSVALIGAEAASTSIGDLPRFAAPAEVRPADAAPIAGTPAKGSGVVDVGDFEATSAKKVPPPPSKVHLLTTQQTVKRVSVFRR